MIVGFIHLSWRNTILPDNKWNTPIQKGNTTPFSSIPHPFLIPGQPLFDKGAFHLAIQGQIPIVPIVVASYHDIYCPREKLFESGEIRVKILPPIDTKGLETKDIESLIGMV
jgi:hypothetical protein